MTHPRSYHRTRRASTMADWFKARKLDKLVATVRDSPLRKLFLGRRSTICGVAPGDRAPAVRALSAGSGGNRNHPQSGPVGVEIVWQPFQGTSFRVSDCQAGDGPSIREAQGSECTKTGFEPTSAQPLPGQVSSLGMSDPSPFTGQFWRGWTPWKVHAVLSSRSFPDILGSGRLGFQGEPLVLLEVIEMK
jgi:hypothetical protein